MSDVVRRLRAAWVPLAVVAAIAAVPLAVLQAAGRGLGEPADPAALPPPAHPSAALAELADRPAEAKLTVGLAETIAAAKGGDDIVVYVQADRAVDFSRVSDRVHAWQMPAGEHVALVWLPPSKVAALAALDGVARVSDAAVGSQSPIVMPMPAPDDELAWRYEPLSPEAGAALAAKAQAAPPWSPVAPDAASGAKDRNAPSAKGGPSPKGWHDVWRGHGAKDAWDQGYTGAGVKVAVLDTSVDFAHPDLQGSYATYEKGAYAGWPEIFDPTGMVIYAQEMASPPAPNALPPTAAGNGGIVRMRNAITVTAGTVNGRDVLTGCISARAVVRVNNSNVAQFLAPNCNYIVPPSKSNRVLHGLHPDANIRQVGAEPNEVPPVLARWLDVILVDANEAGVYDTVYADLDFDRDFTDEKPMTKADPVGWRDINGNGIADFSAGTLYWIADGVAPPPGAYLLGLADEIPEAYSFIAIQADTGGHGTLCASNVASRGRLGVPEEVTLRFRDLPGDGRPMPLNPGMGKEALVVSVGDIYSGGNLGFDIGWRFGVLGADAADASDDPQITSNSYGFSANDDDGWDANSRAIDYYVRTFNPTSTGLYSAGNGGPGYGTIPVPKPSTGMGIAASTQMGSTGWDSILESTQITFGDVTPWSDRGPTAILGIGPHLAADGAYASGSNPLNAVTANQNQPEFKRDGEYANATWGGTSRSSPVAAGLMSLVYQAYKAKHGRWPSWQEARAIAMAGSRFNGYDAFTTGAGVLDGGDAARLAAGKSGVYAMPSEWTSGGFRGQRYPGFASIQHPGTSSKQTFTLSNVDDQPVEVAVSGQWLRRVGSKELPWTSKPVTDEVGSPTSFNAPQYLMPIEREWVPEGTDLMVVRMAYPLEDMDLQAPDGGPFTPAQPANSYLYADNIWRMTVFQHTDHNDNQKLWNDRNGNGIVDFQLTTFYTQTLDATDGVTTRLIDYANAEIEQGEYERFAYANNESNNHIVAVHHPLERWASGIYLGLSHYVVGAGAAARGRTPKVPETTLDIRIDFYSYTDWPWLTVDKGTVTIPAASATGPGTVTVDATMTLPSDAAYGSYVGAVIADYARDTAGGDVPVDSTGGYELPHRRLVVPVNVNVAAQYRWNGPVSFGPSAADPDLSYDNGTVTGAQSWGWRPESGDWRYFMFDAAAPPRKALSYLVTKTTWDDPSERMTDIDTRLYGPVADRYTDPDHPANAAEEGDGAVRDRADSAYYGPYTLGLMASSPRANLNAGRWAFNTSSGGAEDWLSAPAGEGLHEIMLDNVLHSGSSINIPFETTIGSLRVSPSPVVLEGTGCIDLAMQSDLALADIAVQSYGLTTPERFDDQPVQQDDQNSAATATYRKPFELPGEAAQLRIAIDGADDDDLDLFLLYDEDGDGAFNFATEQRATAANGPAADEVINVVGNLPAGDYEIWVHGFTVLGTGKTFDMTIDAIYGDDIAVENPPSSLPAGQPQTLRLCADAAGVADLTAPANGVVHVGPPTSPSMVTIPVTWYPQGTAPTPEPEGPLGVYLPALLRADMFAVGAASPADAGRAIRDGAAPATGR